MTITVSEKYFLTAAIAKRSGRLYILILVSTLLIVSVHEKSVIARPFYDVRYLADNTPISGDQLIRNVRDDDKVQIKNVSGISGKPVAVTVDFADETLEVRKHSDGPIFLKFEGLPKEVSFSTGFRVKEGVWALSLKEVRDLTLFAPSGFSAAFDVKVILHRGKQTERQIHTFRIELAATAVPTPPAAARAVQFAINPEEEAALLARGETLFRGGDFQSSRLIYAELAKRGSREAALRLAQTYDPDVLKSFFVVGAEPNLEKARELYKRAAEMGAIEAQKRLEVLADINLR